jgi:hypothetical protein
MWTLRQSDLSLYGNRTPRFSIAVTRHGTDEQSLEERNNCIYLLDRSRGSSGSTVSDYGLDDRAIGVRSPAGAKDFSSSLCIQTGSGAHPASCTMGTGGPFSGDKSVSGA